MSLFSSKACRMIWKADERNKLAIIVATAKSGQPVDVLQTPSAASITAILPMASLREHNQTDRTFASPSLYFMSRSTLERLVRRARNPIIPIVSASDAVDGSFHRHRFQNGMCHNCGILRNRLKGAIHGRDYYNWS